MSENLSRKAVLVNVDTTTKCVLVCMCINMADDGTGSVSHRTLSEMIGRGRNTIRRCIRKLEDMGIVDTEEMYYQDGGRKPNRYRIRIDYKHMIELVANQHKNDGVLYVV